MRDSIRFRLAFWHLVIVAALQVALGVVIYLVITNHLERTMDSILGTVLESTASAIQSPAVYGRDGILDAVAAVRAVHHIETPIVIYNTGGNVLAERPETVSRLVPLLAPSGYNKSFSNLPAHPELNRGDRRYAVTRVRSQINHEDYFIAASISLSTYEDVLRTGQLCFFSGIPVMLLLTVLGGWRLAGRSLAPAVQMAERARSIGAHNIDDRLPISRPEDEFGRLAGALNELLDRLAAASVSQRQFMADAAHEIRTPLSVMQTAIDVALLKRDGSAVELRQTMQVINEYVERLTKSVNNLFRLARADAGFKTLQKDSHYLDELLSDAVSAARVLASKKDIDIQLGPLTPYPWRGDDSLIQEMFLNLLENSIKYTRNYGRIVVSMDCTGSQYEVVVADTGIGINPQDRDHIFQRFYRGTPAAPDQDPASTPGGLHLAPVEGTGLGLAIAKWIAQSHDGTLELRSSDETGSTFVVHLPAP